MTSKRQGAAMQQSANGFAEIMAHVITNGTDEQKDWAADFLGRQIQSLVDRLVMLLEMGMGVSEAFDQIRYEGDTNGVTGDFGSVMVDSFVRALAEILGPELVEA